MAGEALLVVMAGVEAGRNKAFGDWFDRRNATEMTKVPGILSARRFRATSGHPEHLVLHDLRDLEVLRQPEYRGKRPWAAEGSSEATGAFGGFRDLVVAAYRHVLTLPDPEPADLSGATALMVRGIEIGLANEDEFEDWYNTEHLPALARVPGMIRARRYKLAPEAESPLGDPPPNLAVYDLADAAVRASEAWRQAIDTPWTERMHRLYTNRLRNIYEPVE